MRRRLRALGFLSLAALVAAAGTAEAAAPKKGKKPPSAAAKAKAEAAEAEKEMEVGGALFAAENYAGALPHFERARDLTPDKTGPWRALGYTLKHLDRLPEAREALDRYVVLKGSGPTVDEALAEIRSIDEELRKRELAAAKPLPPPPSPVDDGDGKKLPDAVTDPAPKGGGLGPLRIAGIGGMALGAGALGAGVFFTIKWLGARSGFTSEYATVREALAVEPGVEGTLYICDDADFAMFTATSQEMLGPARAHCGPLSRYRILGPALAAGGLVLVGAGLAIFIAGGGKSGAAPAGEDPYALRLPGLGAVSLDVSPLPGGLMLSGAARF